MTSFILRLPVKLPNKSKRIYNVQYFYVDVLNNIDTNILYESVFIERLLLEKEHKVLQPCNLSKTPKTGSTPSL